MMARKNWNVTLVAAAGALIALNWASAAHADPAPPPAPVTIDPGSVGASGLPSGNDTAVAQLPGGESYSVSLAPDQPMTDNDVDDDEMLVVVDW
jgi:hypothetical protein